MYKPCTASTYNLVFYTYYIVIILIQMASHSYQGVYEIYTLCIYTVQVLMGILLTNLICIAISLSKF